MVDVMLVSVIPLLLGPEGAELRFRLLFFLLGPQASSWDFCSGSFLYFWSRRGVFAHALRELSLSLGIKVEIPWSSSSARQISRSE